MTLIEKIMDLFNANTLDESNQNEIKEKLKFMIENYKNESIEMALHEKLEEFENDKIEELEQLNEEYKDDLTKKLSNFIDEILESEFGDIPDEFKEYAKIGYLYGPIIEQLKINMAIDENVLDEETEEVLHEAKNKINEQYNEINEITDKNLKLQSENQMLESKLYLYDKCEGLTEHQKKSILNLLESEIDKDSIDKKFDIILETIDYKNDEKQEENLNENEENDYGKGLIENENHDLDEEEISPFKMSMYRYVDVLKQQS